MEVNMKLLFILTFGLIMNASASDIFKAQARITVKVEKLEEFKIALKKIIEPTKNEEGCLQYQVFQLKDDDGEQLNVFEFHEVWDSRERMLIDHLEKAAHMQEFFKTIKMGTDESYISLFESTNSYAEEL
jgi:quinol monooxygenase YgiN